MIDNAEGLVELSENDRKLDKDFPILRTPDDFQAMLYRPELKIIKRFKVTKPKKNFWDL